jgi:hypothetical protein
MKNTTHPFADRPAASTAAAPEGRPMPVRRPYLWLLALPFAWQVAMAPVINGVALRPFGLPFPMVWQMAGVVFSSLVFALVFRLDRAAGLEREEAWQVDGADLSAGAGGR